MEANYQSGVLGFTNHYLYDDNGHFYQIAQSGQTGGNAVADKRIDLQYNAAGWNYWSPSALSLGCNAKSSIETRSHP